MFSLRLFFVIFLCMLKIGTSQLLYKDSIFDEDYCDLKCGGKQHTFCPIEEREPACPLFEAHKFSGTSYISELLETLVNGHNGVRNRIAEKMKIPNMLEITWDPKLARMAENFLYTCNAKTADPCTLTDVVFEEEETINQFFKFNHSPAYIVQNMFHEKGMFYPFKFVERVIRYWYFEKDGMRAPSSVSEADNDKKRLLGENNFTHFAYPYVYRFGCGMARFDGGFHILCNYYPFYRTLANTMYFQTGKPASNCPARFPLQDYLYRSLCTDDVSRFASMAVRSTMDMLKILYMFLLIVLLF